MDHSPMNSAGPLCKGVRFARLRALLAASCIGVTIAGTAIAGAFEDGAAAYQRGDYEAAYLRWHSIAELGDRNAQYNIARLYYQGKGVPQDFGEAARWYRRAASPRTLCAVFLGVMLASGKGIRRTIPPRRSGIANRPIRALPKAGGPRRALSHRSRRTAGSRRSVQVVRPRGVPLHLRGCEESRRNHQAPRRMAADMTPAQIADAKKQVGAWKPEITSAPTSSSIADAKPYVVLAATFVEQISSRRQNFLHDQFRIWRNWRKCLNYRNSAVRGMLLATLADGGEQQTLGGQMKSILDPSFRYTKSVETDLKKTFARVRKELRKQSQDRSTQASARQKRPSVLRAEAVEGRRNQFGFPLAFERILNLWRSSIRHRCDRLTSKFSGSAHPAADTDPAAACHALLRARTTLPGRLRELARLARVWGHSIEKVLLVIDDASTCPSTAQTRTTLPLGRRRGSSSTNSPSIEAPVSSWNSRFAASSRSSSPSTSPFGTDHEPRSRFAQNGPPGWTRKT